MPDFDQNDRSILKLLQQDATISVARLAHETHLSTASIQRRVKRLKENGIIKKQVVVISPLHIGVRMTFIITVQLERESVDSLNAFKTSVLNEPIVQQCYYVTGETDFVLICIAPDMDVFEAFTQRLFIENDNIRRFRTNIVMGRTKIGLEVPL